MIKRVMRISRNCSHHPWVLVFSLVPFDDPVPNGEQDDRCEQERERAAAPSPCYRVPYRAGDEQYDGDDEQYPVQRVQVFHVVSLVVALLVIMVSWFHTRHADDHKSDVAYHW